MSEQSATAILLAHLKSRFNRQDRLAPLFVPKEEASVENSLFAMQAALRVLDALTHKRHPDPADIEELHRLAPGQDDLPLDEFACDVIRSAIRSREKAQTAGLHGPT